MSKIFKDELKTSPSNICRAINVNFSNFWMRESKTMTLRFGDIITRVIVSAPKKVHKQVAYWSQIGRGKIPRYFC